MTSDNVTSELSVDGAKYLRAALLDDTEALRYASATISSVIEELCDEMGVSDANFRRLFTEFAFQRALHNMRMVFRHSRSPIERQFLGALVIGMSIKFPFGFLMTAASSDAELLASQYAEGKSQYDLRRSEIMQMLIGKDVSDMSFLNQCIVQVESGALSPDEAQSLAAETFIRAMYDLRFALHATPQAKLPEIKVDGSVVIPDLLVWIPLRKDFRVVAECDGYQWHSDKKHFINDRRRNRTLNFNGYDVHRYSGSEIYADAITASKDFHDLLLMTISRLNPPLEEIKREVSDVNLKLLYVGAGAVIHAAEEARVRAAFGLNQPSPS